MRIGAADLLDKYGSPLKVAEALLLGKLDSMDEDFADDIVSDRVMEAAKFRVANMLHEKKTKGKK